MRKIMIIACLLVCVSGCAALKEIAQNPEEFIAEAQPSIEASSTLLDGVTKNPIDELVVFGIGYASALLRRLYKKKMGSKT